MRVHGWKLILLSHRCTCIILLSILLLGALLRPGLAYCQSGTLCSLPLTITKFEPVAGRPGSGESYRIEWRLDAPVPACLSLDQFIVGYSIDGSLRIDMPPLPGNTFSTIVNYQRSGPPSISAAGRRSATVTGIMTSRGFGEVTHLASGVSSPPADICNQVRMVLALARPAKLVEINVPSLTRGISTPGSQVIATPPAARIEAAITIHRGLPVTWQVQPISRQLCALLENFIVTARVRLTNGVIREGTVTVGADATSAIVPILTETTLSAAQNPVDIQQVEEVRVHARTKANAEAKGSYRNF